MVWILNPNHPSLGASKYYFTSSGNYKVGRKDCAIIIQADKTVSRLHAEIKVDSIDCKDVPYDDLTNFPKPRIFLKDVSKFGSFVNRTAASKPVFSLPNKEKELNEGDLVTFGTDSSSFRLEYLPLLPHILGDESRRESAASIVASIGGCALQQWCTKCTHLIVEDGSNVTETVIQAVAEKKPVVAISWIEAVAARSSFLSEFPSFSRFTPNLLWKIDAGTKFLKIIEPEARIAALKGFRFYVGSMYLYNCRDLLKLLAEASGGIVVSVSEVSRLRVSQNVQQKPDELLILPALEPKLQRWMSPAELKSISHLRRTSEENFIAAVLEGELREEYFEDPTSPAASASSDETVEASNPQNDDEEICSSPQAIRQSSHLGKDLTSRVPLPFDQFGPFQSTTSDVSSRPSLAASNIKRKQGYRQPETLTKEPFKAVEKLPVRSDSPIQSQGVAPSENSVRRSESCQVISDYAGECKAEVEFRKDLVVRTGGANEPLEQCVLSGFTVPNFKRFRKKHSNSGNSFATLVPFAKEPYRESDFNKEVEEYMQQEKKRKQAEAMAEDLFNAEKLKRKSVEKKDVGKKGVGALLMSAMHEGRLKA